MTFGTRQKSQVPFLRLSQVIMAHHLQVYPDLELGIPGMNVITEPIHGAVATPPRTVAKDDAPPAGFLCCLLSYAAVFLIGIAVGIIIGAWYSFKAASVASSEGKHDTYAWFMLLGVSLLCGVSGVGVASGKKK